MSALDAARAVRIEDVLARRAIQLNSTKRFGSKHSLTGPCPRCGGTDRFAVNTEKQLFNCRHCGGKGRTDGKGDVIDLVKFLDGCDTAAAIATLAGDHSGTPNRRIAPPQIDRKANADEHAKRLRTARYLWRKRKPLVGSLGERYIRARGYTGPLPATLGFLPATADYPDPAIVAAFGLAREVEPGVLTIADDAVEAVHLIKLCPDGSDRRRDIENAKITVGIDFAAPIVIAPPNDMLALTIAEGIEDALTDHDLTGRGAWAAASAGRMPGLAALVPIYIQSVTVLVDDNAAGRAGSAALADALDRRGIEVLMAGNWS
jgi:putative DNA primase/helicase